MDSLLDAQRGSLDRVVGYKLWHSHTSAAFSLLFDGGGGE